MTDLNRLQHLRVFSPMATIAATAQGMDSPELDAQLGAIATFIDNPVHCFECKRPLGLVPPSLMGYLDVPGLARMVFVVCEACGDYEEAERKIFDRIGFAAMASGSA